MSSISARNFHDESSLTKWVISIWVIQVYLGEIDLKYNTKWCRNFNQHHCIKLIFIHLGAKHKIPIVSLAKKVMLPFPPRVQKPGRTGTKIEDQIWYELKTSNAFIKEMSPIYSNMLNMMKLPVFEKKLCKTEHFSNCYSCNKLYDKI